LEGEADGFITAIELFAPQSYFMNISARTVRERWSEGGKKTFLSLPILYRCQQCASSPLSGAQKANTGGEYFSGSARKYIIIAEAWRGEVVLGCVAKRISDDDDDNHVVVVGALEMR
jgi:hypothetical protein